MNEPVNFAVIGCGLMGARHAETIINTEDCRCRCLVDRTRGVAEALGRKLGLEVAGSYEEVLGRLDVQVVVICVPSHLHADFGIAAVRSGKHVICEKPIDIRADKAEEFIAAAHRSGVLLTIVSQNRFLEGSMALKKALDDGLLGEPLLANVAVKWFRNDNYFTQSDWRGSRQAEGGGVFMNQAIHYTDLLLWYLGELEDSRMLLTRSRDIIETEDVGSILLRTRSKAIATITASTSAYPGFSERLELHAREGSAILEQGEMVFWAQKDGRGAPQLGFAPPNPIHLDSKLIPFQRQYRDFIEALRKGRHPLVRPLESLAVLKAILDSYDRAI